MILSLREWNNTISSANARMLTNLATKKLSSCVTGSFLQNVPKCHTYNNYWSRKRISCGPIVEKIYVMIIFKEKIKNTYLNNYAQCPLQLSVLPIWLKLYNICVKDHKTHHQTCNPINTMFLLSYIEQWVMQCWQ